MGAVRRNEARAKKFDSVGATMGASKLEHVEEQLQLFRINLENFARKYKDNIRKDPSFRREFQIMCAKIGVDPLASTKGFWAEILGVGSFYTELGVQIVDACVSTRALNGGLIEMTCLIDTVQRMRGSNALDISSDDVERAVKQLRVLGSGFNVVQAGIQRMVVSVPVELNRDHSLLLYAAQGTGGFITVSQMQGGDNRWPEERTRRALHIMLRQGMCWEDRPGSGQPIRYYFPSVWSDVTEGTNSLQMKVGETKDDDGTELFDQAIQRLIDVNKNVDYLDIRNALRSQFSRKLSEQEKGKIKDKLKQ
jgi:ESCRT-II complex subunit VPS22